MPDFVGSPGEDEDFGAFTASPDFTTANAVPEAEAGPVVRPVAAPATPVARSSPKPVAKLPSAPTAPFLGVSKTVWGIGILGAVGLAFHRRIQRSFR